MADNNRYGNVFTNIVDPTTSAHKVLVDSLGRISVNAVQSDGWNVNAFWPATSTVAVSNFPATQTSLISNTSIAVTKSGIWNIDSITATTKVDIVGQTFNPLRISGNAGPNTASNPIWVEPLFGTQTQYPAFDEGKTANVIAGGTATYTTSPSGDTFIRPYCFSGTATGRTKIILQYNDGISGWKTIATLFTTNANLNWRYNFDGLLLFPVDYSLQAVVTNIDNYTFDIYITFIGEVQT